ncbi:phosphotransferase [Variovorax sp. dw_308]|uniref:phosphotransferase enzyme family protein n=1 Tax=Variovorax sp. dw_308 TaxID=2721546 RepID=UPI001C437784
MNDAMPSSPDEHAFRQIALQALIHWNLRPTGISLIKVRENAVFRVDCADGRKAVLRVHRQGYHSDDALRSESEWLAALERDGLQVPRVIPSRHGRPFELIGATSSAIGHQVDIIEWIDGRQLGSVEAGVSGGDAEIARKYRIVGETMARMHNQSSRWQPAKGFVRHSWCEEGLAGLRPLWGRFWELDALLPSQRSLLGSARMAIREDLLAIGKSAQVYGLIHADLVPENFLVDGDDVRVIDFDDAGFGWHLFDVATSLYFLKLEPYFDVAQAALIEGYRRHRDLGDQALASLPMFLAARSTTYLGWVHERKGTATAIELTPMLIELACSVVEDYLAQRARRRVEAPWTPASGAASNGPPSSAQRPSLEST